MLYSIVSPLARSAKLFGGVAFLEITRVMDILLLLEEVFLELVAFTDLLYVF